MYAMHATGIEEKEGTFGSLRELFAQYGFRLGGNWEYDKGSFDCLLHREAEEDIYLRAPFIVTRGELEHEDAVLHFGMPYVLKHVVQTGTEPNTQLANATVNQFQEPADKDADMEVIWAQRGAEVVKGIAAQIR